MVHGVLCLVHLEPGPDTTSITPGVPHLYGAFLSATGDQATATPLFLPPIDSTYLIRRSASVNEYATGMEKTRLSSFT